MLFINRFSRMSKKGTDFIFFTNHFQDGSERHFIYLANHLSGVTKSTAWVPRPEMQAGGRSPVPPEQQSSRQQQMPFDAGPGASASALMLLIKATKIGTLFIVFSAHSLSLFTDKNKLAVITITK